MAEESLALIDATGTLHLEGIAGAVPWWSFTKTVIAIAALRLVERGTLALDAPLAGEEYSLAQLLRHEAGLSDYGGLARYHADVAAGAAPWPVDRLLAETEADRLRYAPGHGWAYSNIGYMKAATHIAQAAGLPLADALRQLVFAPAGLADTRLALEPADLADVAMGGARGYHPGWVYHGLVVGPVVEAARLLHALVTGGLLRPESFARLLDGRPLPEQRSATYPDPAYGLGLMLWAHEPLGHPLGHTGGGPGSSIAVYALGHRVCAVWSAASVPVDPAARAFARLAEALPAATKALE
ncbi:serine hydrolase domain-containing protein [Ferrovibrio xuzhouensis]|uniref:Serine hydrolase domain-containing protein n=1 Tax=Ferrovibrio xuzhouensis TaxID=1576914 RepID=A0ABV7VDP5_9PROT